jgi:hypothetical protein
MRSFIICTFTDIKLINLRRMRCTEKVARMGEMINSHNVLVGMPEEKRPLGRWDDNFKKDLK